jgi:hypothetical protein
MNSSAKLKETRAISNKSVYFIWDTELDHNNIMMFVL